MGRRVSKQTSDRLTRFFWDGDSLCGDATASGLREFVYHPETFEPLAMIEPAPAPGAKPAPGAAPATGRVLHYHNDPNGSPQDVTDARGVVLWSAHYSALGGVDRVYTEEIDQPLRLQGQYADAETGLCYNRFRYFDPETGSFVSQDPAGLTAGINTFMMGAGVGNIVAWIDPLGLTCTTDPKKIRFTQDSIGAKFKDGTSVDDLIRDLKSGKVKPEDVPPIRVFTHTGPDGVLKKGEVYSLDNRRLHAFQQAGIPVRTVQATPAEIAKDSFKQTTVNQGTSIRVRGK
jgi:RHS repeat-associated protein